SPSSLRNSATLRLCESSDQAKAQRRQGSLSTPQNELAAGPQQSAAIINHLSAHESFFYDAAQGLAVVRRQLVPMLNHRRPGGELFVRIPDDDIGVVTILDHAFQIQANLLRRPAAKPSG